MSKRLIGVVAVAFVFGLMTMASDAQAYGGGICINCGFVQPVEIKVPTVVCDDIAVVNDYVFTKDLGPRATGTEVTQLQKKLIKMGYKRVAVTGRYDVQTMIGVIMLQRDNEIRRTGRVDAATRAVLNATQYVEKCTIVYETVTVQNKNDLRGLRERFNEAIRAIIEGRGLSR